MSLAYDAAALRDAVANMFVGQARKHPDPEIAGVEQSIVVAKVHEYTSLEEARADSPDNAQGVKPRVVVLSHAIQRSDGSPRYNVHKGRENRDSSVQIGRSWPLETLTSLDSPDPSSRLLILGFKKPYYWVFSTPESRLEFEMKLREVFQRRTGTLVASALGPPPVPAVSRRRTLSKHDKPSPRASQSPTQPMSPLFAQAPQASQASQAAQTSQGPQGPQAQPVPPQHGSQSHPQAQGSQQGSQQAPQQTRRHVLPQVPQQTPQQAPQSLQQTSEFPQPAPPAAPQPVAQQASQVPQQPHKLPQPPTMQPQGEPSYAPVHGQSRNLRQLNPINTQVGHAPSQASPSQPRTPFSPVYSPGPSQTTPGRQTPSQTPSQTPASRTPYQSQSPAPQQYQSPAPQQYRSPAPPQSQSPAPLQYQSPISPTVPTPPAHAPAHSVAPLRSARQDAREGSRDTRDASDPAIPKRAPTRSNRPLRTKQSKQSLSNGREDPASPFLGQSPYADSPQPPPHAPSHAPMRSHSPAPSHGPVPSHGAMSSHGPVPSHDPTPSHAAAAAAAAGPQELNGRLEPSPSLTPGPERAVSPDTKHARRFSPLKSPSGAAYLHRRSLSGTPGRLRLNPEDQRLKDLTSVIDEFKWDGTNLAELEHGIKERLDELADQHFRDVVTLDSQMGEINAYVKKSIEECNRADAKMQTVAMNLVGKGGSDEMSHIDGRGDGLQILALNYRKLASELERLLDASRLDESFLMQLNNVNLGNPRAPDAPLRLRSIEDMLIDLTQSLDMFSHRAGDAGAVQAAQNPERMTRGLAAQFASNFQRFIDSYIGEVVASNSKPGHLEAQLFESLYIYTGCVLFIRDTSPGAHQDILHRYEREVRRVYQTEFAKEFKTWGAKLSQLVSRERSAQGMEPPESRQHSLAHGPSLDLQPSAQIKKLSPDVAKQVYALFSSLVDTVTARVAGQQSFVERFFHLGSESSDRFIAFVSKEPLPDKRVAAQRRAVAELETMAYFKIDASRSAEPGVLNIMQNSIFPTLGDLVGQAVPIVTEVTPFEAVYLIMVLDIRAYEMRLTSQQFLAAFLEKLHKQLGDRWEELLRGQIRSVLSAHFTTKKRVGVHPVVLMFTNNLSMIETSLSAALESEQMRQRSLGANRSISTYDGDSTRQMVDRNHSNMFRAIAQGLRMGATSSEIQGSTAINAAARLKAAAGGGNVAGEETKELLNRHVVMIENLYRIFTDLERFGSVGVQSIVLDAKQHYKRELEGYIHDVIARPVGKILAFANQYEARSKQPMKQKESVSALKRVLKGFDGRELRAGIDQLRKRVEKHFTASDPDVLRSVWQAISVEYLNLYARVQRIAQNLDAAGYIEVQRSEVVDAFN